MEESPFQIVDETTVLPKTARAEKSNIPKCKPKTVTCWAPDTARLVNVIPVMMGERKECIAVAEPWVPPIETCTGNGTELGRFAPAASLQETDDSEIQWEYWHAVCDIRNETDVSDPEYEFPKTWTTNEPVLELAPLIADIEAAS
jgi:hypothetical protein